MSWWSRMFGKAGPAAPNAERRGGPPPDDVRVGYQFRQYPVDAISPESVRTLERLADDGDSTLYQELLDDVAKDAHVQAELLKIKLPIAGAEVTIEPGDETPRAREIADEAWQFWQAIPDRAQLQVDLLDAEYRGFAVVRPRWEYRSGRFWIVEHEPIEARMFLFPRDAEGRQRPRVITERAGWSGEDVPSAWLYYRVRDKAGPVARSGVGRSILRPWLYKGFCLVDGMSFLERFGHPHVQVEIGPNVKEGTLEFERAKAAARNIIVDNYALVPVGATLKIIDTLAKAANLRDVYLAMADWCDAAISKAANSQTLTTQQGEKGAYSLGKVHEGVAQKLLELRARRLGEFLTRRVLGAWCAYNFGADAPVPQFVHQVAPPEDRKALEETRLARARTLEVLSRLRLRLAAAPIREEMATPEPKAGEEVIEPAPTPAPAREAA